MSDSAKSSPAHSFKGDLFDEVPTNPDQTVIDGWLKFRDQKKWKLRWGVVTKLSPAAGSIKKVVTAERDASPQLDGRPVSANRNYRPSVKDPVFDASSDAQFSRDLAQSKPVAEKSPSQVVGHFDPQVVSPLPASFRSRSTKILAFERWAPWTPPLTMTTTKFASRFVRQAPTTDGLVTSSTDSTSSIAEVVTGSSTSKAGDTKEASDFLASPSTGATSMTADPQWKTSSGNGNASLSSFSTTLAPSVNGTRDRGNTSDYIDTKCIVDVPHFGCREGEKMDEEGSCRKVL